MQRCGKLKNIKRDVYLKRLIDREQNGLVKIITGIRRSGKSYLLNNLFYDYLKERNYYVDDDCLDVIETVKKHQLISEESLNNIVSIVYKSRRSFKHDPVEMTTEYLSVIDEVEKEIFKKRTVFGMGACHEIWALKEEALAKRGISWMSPGMLNPRVMFD